MSYFLGGKNQAFLIDHKILKFLWPSGPFPALSDPPSASWSKNTSLALFGEFLLVIFTDGPLSSALRAPLFGFKYLTIEILLIVSVAF